MGPALGGGSKEWALRFLSVHFLQCQWELWLFRHLAPRYVIRLVRYFLNSVTLICCCCSRVAMLFLRRLSHIFHLSEPCLHIILSGLRKLCGSSECRGIPPAWGPLLTHGGGEWTLSNTVPSFLCPLIALLLSLQVGKLSCTDKIVSTTPLNSLPFSQVLELYIDSWNPFLTWYVIFS